MLKGKGKKIQDGDQKNQVHNKLNSTNIKFHILIS